MTIKAWNPVAACLALAVAAPAFGQGAERVASHTDWAVFVASNPKECYIVAPPKTSTATRDGKKTDVDRGDIRLFVSFRPGSGVSNEVSFTGGYPFQAGRAVTLKVGGTSLAMSPGTGDSDEWAWTDPSEDANAVAALRKGSEAVLTGVSTRGTTTTDTFSLAGFTAAVTDAEARCK